MSEGSFTIEARSRVIVNIGVARAAHDFWILKDNNGNIVAELDGYAYDRVTKETNTSSASSNNSLQVYQTILNQDYNGIIGAQTIKESPYQYEDSPDQKPIIAASGSKDEILDRWNAAVKQIQALNSLDLDYHLGSFNSNSAYRTLGELMGLEPHEFSGRWEPGLEQRMISLEIINKLKYDPSKNPEELLDGITVPISSSLHSLLDFNNLLHFLNNIFSTSEAEAGEVPEDISSSFTSAQRYVVPPPPRYYDPLVFDLDGDGIETVASGSTNTVLFDHDGDGMRIGTGWVGSDDGFLVRDHNVNGQIDSGREMYGHSTQLPDGAIPEDGFAALASEDTNGDGVVNNQDANWSSLRIWRDLNQDGISQSDELSTLESLNIASISLAKTEHSSVLPGGNSHSQTGTYTTTDGQTRAATDVWFKTDSLYSFATEILEVPEDIFNLPEISGYGMYVVSSRP